MEKIYNISLELTENQVIAITEGLLQEVADLNDLINSTTNNSVKKGLIENISMLQDVLIQLENA